ncbi:serine-type endopeptidase activity protein [Homalodisca vitripennis]|nr:serine-type endopeptidase activity protein [Homalodisca vitripennis]
MFYCSLLILLLLSLTCKCQYDRARMIEGASKLRKLPLLDVCGLSRIDIGTRIINGKPAKLGAYPWMALVGYRRQFGRRTMWGCGGSLVTNQHVVTAAHCGYPPILDGYNVYEVRLGDLDMNDTIYDGAYPLDFGVESFTMHEHYDNNKKVNDVAIIKIKGKVQFTDLIRPICLPPPEFRTNMFVDFAPVAAGWGVSVNNSAFRTDTRLLEAELTIQDLDECRTNVTTKLTDVQIDDSVICAYSPTSDTCQGDSGGPLMFPKTLSRSVNTTGNMFLMGIVSYGYMCALPGFPSVYTRVAHHMAWIVEHLDV